MATMSVTMVIMSVTMVTTSVGLGTANVTFCKMTTAHLGFLSKVTL